MSKHLAVIAVFVGLSSSSPTRADDVVAAAKRGDLASTWPSSARTSSTRSVPTPSTAAASPGGSRSTATTSGRSTAWRSPSSGAPSTAPGCRYVGSQVCAECHTSETSGGQSVHWMRSAHARSYWMLKTDWARHLAAARKEYRDIDDPSAEWRCLKCHTTGAQDQDSGPAASFRREEGVGCEACHGPGSAYVDPSIMADRQAFLSHGGRLPDEATCRECHQDDQFRYEEGLHQIAHPRPVETDDHS